MKELLFNSRRKKEEKKVIKNIVRAYMKAFDELKPRFVYGANPSGIRKAPDESPEVVQESQTEVVANTQSKHDLDANEVADLDPYGVRSK